MRWQENIEGKLRGLVPKVRCFKIIENKLKMWYWIVYFKLRRMVWFFFLHLSFMVKLAFKTGFWIDSDICCESDSLVSWKKTMSQVVTFETRLLNWTSDTLACLVELCLTTVPVGITSGDGCFYRVKITTVVFETFNLYQVAHRPVDEQPVEWGFVFHKH